MFLLIQTWNNNYSNNSTNTNKKENTNNYPNNLINHRFHAPGGISLPLPYDLDAQSLSAQPFHIPLFIIHRAMGGWNIGTTPLSQCFVLACLPDTIWVRELLQVFLDASPVQLALCHNTLIQGK